MIDDGDLTIDGADLMAQIRAGATDPGTDRRTTGWRPPVAPVPAAATEPSVGGMSRIQAGIVGGIVVLGLTIGVAIGLARTGGDTGDEPTRPLTTHVGAADGNDVPDVTSQEATDVLLRRADRAAGRDNATAPVGNVDDRQED